jgi:hypothetical protein
MTPSYEGGIAGAAVYQLSILQLTVQSAEFLELDFLRCFQHLDTTSHIDYESLLAWVYWRSIATFATDPRDYVFGILGIANAIANTIGLTYDPFKADYSLSTAEVFQKFTLRIMSGHFGIPAITLNRPSRCDRVPGLPSWYQTWEPGRALAYQLVVVSDVISTGTRVRTYSDGGVMQVHPSLSADGSSICKVIRLD